jgi:hypothetical protein
MMKTRLSALCATLLVLAAQAPAQAGTVTLHASDNQLRIEGHLLSVNATHYMIQTSYGKIRIERAVVSCQGNACPMDGEQVPSVGDSMDGQVLSSGS